MLSAVGLARLIVAAFLVVAVCPLGAREPGSVRTELQPVAPQSLLVLRRGEQKIFKSKPAIRRLAVSNPEICTATHYDGTTLSLVARGAGKSDVTVWFEDATRAPMIWVVEVK